MTFEIRPIGEESSPLEAISFTDLLGQYVRAYPQLYAPELIEGGLVGREIQRIYRMQRHGLLAFEGTRDKRGKIIRDSFNPLGIATYNLQGRGPAKFSAHVDKIYAPTESEFESGVIVLMLHDIVSGLGELKNLAHKKRKKIEPPSITLTLPREPDNNFTLYSLLGFKVKEEHDNYFLLTGNSEKIFGRKS